MYIILVSIRTISNVLKIYFCSELLFCMVQFLFETVDTPFVDIVPWLDNKNHYVNVLFICRREYIGEINDDKFDGMRIHFSYLKLSTRCMLHRYCMGGTNTTPSEATINS